MTIIDDRVKELEKATLAMGSHPSFEEGACAMEWVAYLAGEGHTDAPECASKVLREFTISLNDQWDDENRQRLAPFLPRMVGTAGDGHDEARSYLALDWLIRTHTPAWLDLAGLTVEAQELRGLRRIVDIASAREAGPKVRAAREKATAAWAAAGYAAGYAAGRAAGYAAWCSAWAAAGDAAWAAAGDAAVDVAVDVLSPTVETLQASALDMLDRMIDPKEGSDDRADHRSTDRGGAGDGRTR